jgi:hypothetical protein
MCKIKNKGTLTRRGFLGKRGRGKDITVTHVLSNRFPIHIVTNNNLTNYS